MNGVLCKSNILKPQLMLNHKTEKEKKLEEVASTSVQKMEKIVQMDVWHFMCLTAHPPKKALVSLAKQFV